MTQTDLIACVHEPFAPPFYMGPERLSDRYENNKKERIFSGMSERTYKSVIDDLDAMRASEVGALALGLQPSQEIEKIDPTRIDWSS